MKGRVAVVTGSTSGIGQGIAEQFASAGVNVVLNGFGPTDEIEALRAGLAERHSVQVRYHGADMTQPEQIRSLIDWTTAELGRVDVLVNNAGIQHTAPVQEFPADRWDAILAINLSSAFHAIQAALPQMLERDWGRIINIASVHGLVASIHKAAYVAAKHGLVGLTKVVALETARSGVTCNAICPGWVLTSLVQKQIDALAQQEGLSREEAQMRLLGAKQPSQNFATPEQIGQMALWLCSEHALQIRGASLTVDGGWVAQ